MRTPSVIKFEVDVDEFPDTQTALLSDLVDDPDFETHHWAREVLVKMGPKVLPMLNKVLGSNNKILRREAIKVIELIGHRSSIPILIASLEDPESDVRWIAAEGLIHIGRKSIRPLLNALVGPDTSYFLRLGAHHVLSELVTSEDQKELQQLVHHLKQGFRPSESIPLEADEILKGE